MNSFHPSGVTTQTGSHGGTAEDLASSRPGIAGDVLLPDVDELFYHYQPILGTGSEPVIYEALVRWLDPAGKVAAPVDFLSHLLNSGDDMLDRFTAHTIDHAARALTDHPHLERMSINLSPAQICRHESLAMIRSLPFNLRTRLIIEVTENHLPERETYSLWLGETAALGVDLVLDDVLPSDLESRLPPQLPIEGIKFDHTVLGQLIAAEPDRELLDMIKGLRRLKLSLTAEGVQNAAQVKQLSAIGFERFQGYGLGMPAATIGPARPQVPGQREAVTSN